MNNNKIDLADFNELLSLQTAPTVQADPAEPTPAPTPKELAQFPSDYFFSALAELVLDDWKFVVSVI